jgi:hypothetical protein
MGGERKIGIGGKTVILNSWLSDRKSWVSFFNPIETECLPLVIIPER